MVRIEVLTFITCCILPHAGEALNTLQDDVKVVPDRYIVSLKPELSQNDVMMHLEWVADVHSQSLAKRSTVGVDKQYSIGHFRAYAGEFDRESIIQIRENGNVLSVEPDTMGTLCTVEEDKDAPWGLASISSRRELAYPSIRDQRYIYDDTGGDGTFAYVLDTGIHLEHPDFEGRAIKGYNAFKNIPVEDEHGHGTHVSGTIGSAHFGVAKKTTLVDVTVLNGLHSTLTVLLDGYNWAVNNITNTSGRSAKSVINMSLEFPRSNVTNSAIDAATSLGVVTVVAAGNAGFNASRYSPASASTAITAGGMSWDNSRASWSNYGESVDIFAPGMDVLSTSKHLGGAEVMSGTSMSAAHISGLVVYLQSLEGAAVASPAAVTARIKQLATRNVLRDPAGSPNLLAHNGNKYS